MHVYKSNMLADSLFRKSKQDQDLFSSSNPMPIAEYVAFKYIEDLYLHRNFAEKSPEYGSVEGPRMARGRNQGDKLTVTRGNCMATF